jgi:hypothetical protein
VKITNLSISKAEPIAKRIQMIECTAFSQTACTLDSGLHKYVYGTKATAQKDKHIAGIHANKNLWNFVVNSIRFPKAISQQRNIVMRNSTDKIVNNSIMILYFVEQFVVFQTII